MKYPHPDNDPDHNEWLEKQIHNEIDKGIDQELWNKITGSTGSFSKLAEVERRLKREKKN